MSNRNRQLDASASKSKHTRRYRRLLHPTSLQIGLTVEQSSDIDLGRSLRSHHKRPGRIVWGTVSVILQPKQGLHMTFVSN
jgi:hypothetical protein